MGPRQWFIIRQVGPSYDPFNKDYQPSYQQITRMYDSFEEALAEYKLITSDAPMLICETVYG